MRIVLITILTHAVCLLYAQKYVDTYDPKDDQVKSLLSKENDINGFGATDLKVTDFKGERGLMVGGYGGFIINRRFLFGVAGYGIVTNVEIQETLLDGSEGPRMLNLHGGYAGILIAPTIAPKEVIHVSMPIVFGAGSIEVVDKNFFPNNVQDSEFTIENSVFFAFEPGVELEFNITNYFRLGAGATYRYAVGSEFVNLTDDDLTGLSGFLSFRFGRF